MEQRNRHSSPASTPNSPRPHTYRNRSNSVPIVEALGCSTPEAELIMAEGMAAVRSRHNSRRRGGHKREGIATFSPWEHLKYLEQVPTPSASTERSLSSNEKRFQHSRTPSNTTDRSSCTIIAPDQLPVDDSRSTPVTLGSPLEDYSANIARFIQTQLRSISAHQPTSSSVSPSSCPDLTFSRSPPQSPTKSNSRLLNAPRRIEIPAVRPPLQSQFSGWSSAGDDTDDEAPRLPTVDLPAHHLYAPSVLHCYEASSNFSFLFPSTPKEDEIDPQTAKASTFPDHVGDDDDYPTSAHLTRPQLTPSSAPSFSSASTESYFEYKRPFSIDPRITDRIIAAVTPRHGHGKIIPAVSPFEGGAFSNTHNVLVESQQRVRVDGMSFDMQRDFRLPDEGMRTVTTPC